MCREVRKLKKLSPSPQNAKKHRIVSVGARIVNYERTIEKIQGEVATLLCEVEGIPAPTVTWKKNYVQIDTESDPNYDILEDGSLLIKQVKVLLVTFLTLTLLIQ